MAELALTMPKMSMTMEEGTMVAWLKQPGDAVKSGEPVCEVATDKVDMEVESPFDGVLARTVAEPDDVIAVGDPIAYITTDADDLLGGLFDAPDDASAAAPDAVPEAATATAAPEADPMAADPVADAQLVPSVPAARALATANGVDLAAVPRTGPWGSVTVRDVEAADAAAEPAPTQPAEPAQPQSAESSPSQPVVPVDAAARRRLRTRRAVARAMSATTAVPQFTVFADLDLEALAAVRASELGGAGWTVLLMRAQALALAASPAVHSTWVDDTPVHQPTVGIALAIDSPTGLVAPVFVDPHRMRLAELSELMRDTVDHARAGTLPPERLAGGTSVLSNLGGFGVERFDALLTPPQASAMSVGAIARRIVVNDDGSFAPRLCCTVGLTVDHRVADGADAARVIQSLREVIATPARLA